MNPSRGKKIERLELKRHPGHVTTFIEINDDRTVHVYLQRLEDKINELIDKLERK